MIRTPSCLWELCHSSLPFQSLGLPPSFNQLFVLYHSQRNLSINNNTLSAACIVGFVLPVHQERKRLTKNRKREKSFCFVLFYKDPQTLIIMVGIMWLIKGILGILKPASLWAGVCVCARVHSCFPYKCYGIIWGEVPLKWRQSPTPSKLPCYTCPSDSKGNDLFAGFFPLPFHFCFSWCCCWWCFNMVHSFHFNIFLMLLLF